MKDIKDMTNEERFIEYLGRASYHRAADVGLEFMEAEPYIRKAAAIAREEGWDEAKVKELMGRDVLATPGEIMRHIDRQG